MTTSVLNLALQPILYVADPFAEREFFKKFGFETEYEGDEFPGFLAVRSGEIVIGLSRNRSGIDTRSYDGTQWQFTVDNVDDVVDICERAGMAFEVEDCEGGDSFRMRIVHVSSPNGVPIWFEGPNEIMVGD